LIYKYELLMIFAIMLWLYIIVCFGSFLLVFWVMFQAIRRNHFPPNNNDDDGGIGGSDLPIIDIPPGGKMEDILTDRWYDDVPIFPK